MVLCGQIRSDRVILEKNKWIAAILVLEVPGNSCTWVPANTVIQYCPCAHAFGEDYPFQEIINTMNGQERLEVFATGAATASTLFLSWYLFGLELTIICAGITVLGIVLSHTPSHRPKPARSRKTLPLSPSFLSKLASVDETVNRKPAHTRRDAIVITDSPVSFQPQKRKRSKHLAAVQRSPNFEGGF